MGKTLLLALRLFLYTGVHLGHAASSCTTGADAEALPSDVSARHDDVRIRMQLTTLEFFAMPIVWSSLSTRPVGQNFSSGQSIVLHACAFRGNHTCALSSCISSTALDKVSLGGGEHLAIIPCEASTVYSVNVHMRGGSVDTSSSLEGRPFFRRRKPFPLGFKLPYQRPGGAEKEFAPSEMDEVIYQKNFTCTLPPDGAVRAFAHGSAAEIGAWIGTGASVSFPALGSFHPGLWRSPTLLHACIHFLKTHHSPPQRLRLAAANITWHPLPSIAELLQPHNVDQRPSRMLNVLEHPEKAVDLLRRIAADRQEPSERPWIHVAGDSLSSGLAAAAAIVLAGKNTSRLFTRGHLRMFRLFFQFRPLRPWFKVVRSI
mmetsp:Transcript_4908/g.14468  ORF Transcript_4908/g.14468 Transcript_4908/m.14468 type:complete len:373 (-) Transcript_4908:740-1858(-)